MDRTKRSVEEKTNSNRIEWNGMKSHETRERTKKKNQKKIEDKKASEPTDLTLFSKMITSFYNIIFEHKTKSTGTSNKQQLFKSFYLN